MMPALAELPRALWAVTPLFAVYTGLPALALGWIERQRPRASDVFIASALLLSAQAVASIILFRLFPSLPPASALFLLPAGLWVSVSASRSLPRTAHSDRAGAWLATILLLALLVRAIPPLHDAALGQSDAYSHLQFLRDVVETGHLRNPFYPPGHARVSAVACWIAGVDPYALARHGGAFYGVTLVGLVHALMLRIAGERTALLAALLAAGFPAAAPLLRTGVGLFANQLGLVQVAALGAAVHPMPLQLRAWAAPAVLAAGLLVSVPMMLVDLVPLILVLLLLRASKHRWRVAGLAALGVLVLAGVVGLNAIPEETRGAMVRMLTRRVLRDATVGRAVTTLVLDYLSIKSSPYPVLYRIAVALCASAALLASWRLRNTDWLPLLMLCAITGFQTSTGILQFSTYQRAGWMFLISACGLGGAICRWIEDRQVWGKRLVRLGLAASCLFSIVHPPQHRPHLSPSENALVAELVRLRRETKPLHVHTRAFTRFHGGQGDPARAILEGNPGLTLHSYNPGEAIAFPVPGGHVFLLETRDPEPTGDAVFDAEVARLHDVNHSLRQALSVWQTFPSVQLISSTTHDGLETLVLRVD